MIKMKKEFGLILMVFMGVVFLWQTGAEATTVTIATFDDPTFDSSTPLFKVDLIKNLITGGWADSQNNLDLDIKDTVYENAYFTMTPISYTTGVVAGATGSGTITFFENNQNTPLIQIDFDSARVSPLYFGGMDQFFADGVVITGSAIDTPVYDESFSFSFANQQAIDGDWNNGFTATAAFTSSAIPEPATVLLLGAGGMAALMKKRKLMAR